MIYGNYTNRPCIGNYNRSIHIDLHIPYMFPNNLWLPALHLTRHGTAKATDAGRGGRTPGAAHQEQQQKRHQEAQTADGPPLKLRMQHRAFIYLCIYLFTHNIIYIYVCVCVYVCIKKKYIYIYI